MATSVYGVVIGNEVLSGKVVDANTPFLIRALAQGSIPLVGLSVVRDDVSEIVQALRHALSKAKVVVTAGGIGPTHDDVTLQAISEALGRPLIVSKELEQLVIEKLGLSASQACELARVPEGCQIKTVPGFWYPILATGNVFALPGIPKLFEAQLMALLREWEPQKLHFREVWVDLYEHQFAETLRNIATKHPEVQIGSYPATEKGAAFRVKLVLEGSVLANVEEAAKQLLLDIPTSRLS